MSARCRSDGGEFQGWAWQSSAAAGCSHLVPSVGVVTVSQICGWSYDSKRSQLWLYTSPYSRESFEQPTDTHPHTIVNPCIEENLSNETGSRSPRLATIIRISAKISRYAVQGLAE